jgi:3'-phosphoadenosine 5'-phosphosulfate sulfotransferase (PAPS reductase)/FAD synthetase
LPFPLMHVDTGHNYPEVIEFRDRRAAELNADPGGWNPIQRGINRCRGALCC